MFATSVRTSFREVDTSDVEDMSPSDASEQTEDPRQDGFLRRHRCLSAVVVVIAGMAVFHGPMFRLVYGALVVDQPTDHCQYAMIATPTPECFDAAARMVNGDGAEMILIAELRPERTVRVGAVPGIGELWLQDLVQRDIPVDRVRTIKTDALTPQQMFRELEVVLSSEGESNCAVISTSTLSRYYRTVIDGALPQSDSLKYRVRSVLPKASDASGWWRTRSGVARVMHHGLRLAFAVCQGESKVNPEDPYAYLTQPQVAD